MMRFNFVLLLAIVCPYVLAEDGKNCMKSYPGTYLIEAFCPPGKDARVWIRINGDNIKVVCLDESSWSDWNFYMPNDTHWAIHIIRIVNCSWKNASLHDIFRAWGNFEIRTFVYHGVEHFGPSLGKSDLYEVAHVRQLVLINNGFRELAVDVFEDFANLLLLVLRSNNISVLHRGTFSHVPELMILDLGDNNITLIDELLFQNLTQLILLNLMENHLTSLRANTFRGPTKLRTLYLTDNRLGSLPKDLFVSSTNLRNLDISGNKFSEINEEAFARNNELNSVSFCNNRGNSSEPLAFLSVLYIWPKLETLELTRDDLRILPENIFQTNVDLIKLNLSGNALETLRKDVFKGLENLEILDISANQLNNIHPNTFSPLVSLTELYLERNNLTTIHPIPESVEILNAAYNQILNFSAHFRHLESRVLSLRVLRLSHNLLGISEENVNFFLTWLPTRCEKLEEIYLDYNEIQSLENVIPTGFTDLSVVDLSNNRLDKFQVNLNVAASFHTYFYVPGPIRTGRTAMIDVRHNMIDTITVSSEALSCYVEDSDLAKGVISRFGDNPIICDCNVYGLLLPPHSTLLEWRNCFVVDLYNLTCSDPPWMKGVPVEEIDHKKFACRLDTDETDCPETCECWWRPYDTTRLLNCSYRNSTQAPGLSGGSSECPIELNLTGNYLTELPSLNGSGYELVTKLFLSHNNISNVSFDVVSPILKVLQLEHNNLTSFDARTKNAIKQAENLDSLTLFDNPWDCDRETREFLAYIDQKYSMETTVSARKQCLDQPTVQNRVQRRKSYITVVQF